jgi:hypothetical protein
MPGNIRSSMAGPTEVESPITWSGLQKALSREEFLTIILAAVCEEQGGVIELSDRNIREIADRVKGCSLRITAPVSSSTVLISFKEGALRCPTPA